MINKTRSNFTCRSGGAIGADTCFEEIAESFGVAVDVYSYKTKTHTSKNKVELTEAEFQEGIEHVEVANHTLQKLNYQRYFKLLARNWFIVKNAKHIYAITTIKKVKGKEMVAGGTGWAVQMAMDNHKSITIFDQKKKSWFIWDYTLQQFQSLETAPKITNIDFAGIGARNINADGIKAIENLFENSFKKPNL
ncbi:hypothetical protein SAMN05443667_10812 [Flavobacterium gillisiae]|uniref:Uncharacterized protein n=2 Tax=Flavobacteriaceae TaxID=49546 RepID=A0A1H4DMV0_9FLAO|nr:hypothetical protein SAMN05443667_10812 [Flavobacterium gillisiae]